jgi:adenine-specific DNA-methyltransferase
MENKNYKRVNLTSSNLSEEKLAELSRILPEAFCEGKIDWQKLKEVLGSDFEPGVEKFSFSWAGKTGAVKNVLVPSKATLKPAKDESVKFDESENIFVEGDNLEVLKLLQKAYFEKVKMIYIDPPYNTGGDFVYKDDFSAPLKGYLEQTGQIDGNGNKMQTNRETNGRYHSDWLSMMYPRLKLAWNLLRDDGVIFISIDDNEVHHLRMLMDEIFGEENFIACITIEGNPRGRDYGGVARMHDFLLVYTKSAIAEINSLNEPNKEFPYSDLRGGFEIRELRNRNIAFHIGNRPNLYYPFYVNTEKQDENGFFEISLEKKSGWVAVYPKESQGYKTVWRWGKDKSAENLNTEIVGKQMESGVDFQIVEKYRKTTRMARSIWLDKDVNTEKGTLLLKEIFNSKVFSFPKPLEMIMRIIEMGSVGNDVVLDFFAGSATTAQATLMQNIKDGSTRKFVLIQFPESTEMDSEAYKNGYKTIADIAKERIRRVIKGYGENQQPINSGFKVFKLDKSNYPDNNFDFDPDKSEEENKTAFLEYLGKARQAKLFEKNQELDVVYENIIKEGLSLNSKIQKTKIAESVVYQISNGEKQLLICLENKISLKTIKELTQPAYKGKLFICLDNALDDTTKANLALNVELKTI